MQVYRFRTTITTAGGTGSANTNSITGGLCHQIVLTAPNTNASFKARIVDAAGVTVREYLEPIIDTYLDGDIRPILMTGVYTIQIFDTARDGDFIVQLLVRE